jgi:PAS domain S-box-containing protein
MIDIPLRGTVSKEQRETGLVADGDRREAPLIDGGRGELTVQSVASLPLPVRDAGVSPERALRLSAELCRGIVETSSDAIGLADTTGALVMVNQSAVELFGYRSAEDMLGLSALQLIAPQDRARAEETIRHRMALQETRGRHVEYTLVRADGSTVPAELSSTVIVNDDGQPVWLTIVARDITERKQAEERQRQLEQQKEIFLSAVAHDLRTPITAVKGRAQLLRRMVMKLQIPELTRIADGLAELDASATRMTKMITELLEMTRLTSGRPIELDRQEIDILPILRRLVEDQQRSALRHTIVLNVSDDDIRGLWDAVRVERAIANLLLNAVKYSPSGGTVTVRAWTGRDAAHIAVADEGIGIPPADVPHVFERFHRGSNVVGSIGGTGIGLSAALQIVKQHGGTISVESHLGAGSTFTLSLPFHAEVESHEAE